MMMMMMMMIVVLSLTVNESSCDGGDVGPTDIDNGSGEYNVLDYVSRTGDDECRRNFADDGRCDDYYADGAGEGGRVSNSTFREVLGRLHVQRLLRL
jgi:hypothetical protein